MHLIKFVVFLCLAGIAPAHAAQKEPPQIPKVDADVALSSLMALGDQHIESLADSLRLLASTAEARSADWSRIQEPLAAAGRLNVEALNWFALPDGSYWSVQNGKESQNLSDRAYFPALLKGNPVIGELVVSKATGQSAAIVAVPVIRDKKVVGIVGASVYLDKLSALLEKQMGLDRTMIFYSFDEKPIVGLDWDPAIILADPKKLGKEVSSAFDKMVRKDEGSVQYTFRGKKRTVVFKKSSVTGWWYAFGRIPEGREEKGTSTG